MDLKKLFNRHYRRLVFDLDEGEVSLEELMESGLLLAVYADFYYKEDIQYDEKPYGALCLYDYLSETLLEHPERGDRQALKKYGQTA